MFSSVLGFRLRRCFFHRSRRAFHPDEDVPILDGFHRFSLSRENSTVSATTGFMDPVPHRLEMLLSRITFGFMSCSNFTWLKADTFADATVCDNVSPGSSSLNSFKESAIQIDLGVPKRLIDCSRSTRVQAEDLCKNCAVYTPTSYALPLQKANSCGPSVRWFWSGSCSRHRLHALLNDEDGKDVYAPFSRGKRDYCSCNSYVPCCGSVNIPPIEVGQSRAKPLESDPGVEVNGAVRSSRKTALPADELAELLFSAAQAPGSADSARLTYETCIRFKRTPPKNFIFELHEKLQFLKSESWALCHMKDIFKSKLFLYTSSEELQVVYRVLKDFFQSSEKAYKVISECPAVLQKTEKQLKETLNVLLEFQIQPASMEINPKVLVSDADKARISLRFLKDWGLSSADMNKIIHRDLRILSLSGDTSIQPALTFLESIGTSRDKIVELMILCPRIFHRGIGDRLIQKYDICQKLGINFHSAMRYIMLHRTERVFSQVEFFREQGFSDEDIVNLFEKEPRILAKSKGDLKVKLQFFTQIHNRSIAEIIKFPACLCYSFKNRILPRLTILKERGFPDKMNLFYILAVTDSAFRNICQTSDRISPH